MTETVHKEGPLLQRQPASTKFPRLFEAGYIGNLRVKNRIIKAPTLTCYAGFNGEVTDRLIRHYRELARGGTGVVMVEYTYVDNDASQSGRCQPSLSRDDCRPGMEWLASTIKANGAAACIQLVHAGRQKFTGEPPIKTATRSPWEELHALGVPIPEEITIEEIKELIKNFGMAAMRAKEVGFDMIEIHAAHGYLLTNFLSPKNRRADWYGGNLTNRMRILLEIVGEIRSKVGNDYPICVRLSAVDYEEEEPITIEETKVVAKALEDAGVDMIHISGGDHHTMHYEVSPMHMPLALHVKEAGEIKKVINIPVVASGSIVSPDLAEEALRGGKADFIGLARPLLADPFWALKAREDRPEDIRPCIRCDECISARGHVSDDLVCTVNPSLGKEGYFEISPSDKRKKVAVIGGGPAGMEAARVASLRGHEVTLFEKRKLGGRLMEAAAPDFKEGLKRLLGYLKVEVEKSEIKVVYQNATYKEIMKAGFDVVVVANGGAQRVLDVSGLNKPLVKNYLDVLTGSETGKEVVVIGGALGGCDVALQLAEAGKKVTIVEMVDEIGGDMNMAERKAFFERLSKQSVSVTLRPGWRLVDVTDKGVVVQNKFDRKDTITADTVVMAVGFKPDLELFENLTQDKKLEIYAIGDCVRPRMVFDAIHEGFWCGFQI